MIYESETVIDIYNYIIILYDLEGTHLVNHI